MSAWLCSNKHLTVVARAIYTIFSNDPPSGLGKPATVHRTLIEVESPIEAIGRELIRENHKSLEHRYEEKVSGIRSGFISKLGAVAVCQFSSMPVAPLLNVLKLTQSYQYQSCEDEVMWDISLAKYMTDLVIYRANLELLAGAGISAGCLVRLARSMKEDVTFAEVADIAISKHYKAQYDAAMWAVDG